MAQATEILRDPASFRDPSGFIFERDGVKLRQVNACYAADYDHFLASGLYDELAAAGLLLPHEEMPPSESATDEAYKVLLPTQLSWVSYPYEWSFSQLRDAALVTLEIQRRALAKGMTLKDASAYNVQLHRGRIVFIDTLSFERYTPGQAWVAYRQFCQHFLAPLTLMSRTDVRLNQLLRVYLDGVPLDLASRLLPWKSRFSLSSGLHIHAHARTQRRHAQTTTPVSKALSLKRRQLEALISGLDAAVHNLRWKPSQSEWSDYYTANNNYGEQGMDAKQRLVRALMEQVGPRTVWDVGANDGRFSRIAAEVGAETVVAWDIDPTCVEHNYRQVVNQREPAIYPLLLDLTNPTPGVGWANLERTSFLGRGPVDLVLALGLVHHLAIANNTSLEQIGAYLAAMCQWLVVEWAPKHDSQVQRLLRSRQDIFSDYTQVHFEAALRQHFALVRMEPIPQTQRSLYLFRIDR